PGFGMSCVSSRVTSHPASSNAWAAASPTTPPPTMATFTTGLRPGCGWHLDRLKACRGQFGCDASHLDAHDCSVWSIGGSPPYSSVAFRRNLRSRFDLALAYNECVPAYGGGGKVPVPDRQRELDQARSPISYPCSMGSS